MNDEETRPRPATLAAQAQPSADVERIADRALSMWHDAASALSPIIGERGVAALFRRSLYFQQIEHPGLATAYAAASQPDAFVVLRATLLQQTPAAAAAANDALLQTFIDLLSSLIGPALTERLIGFVHPLPSIGTAVQDKQP